MLSCSNFTVEKGKFSKSLNSTFSILMFLGICFLILFTTVFSILSLKKRLLKIPPRSSIIPILVRNKEIFLIILLIL